MLSEFGYVTASVIFNHKKVMNGLLIISCNLAQKSGRYLLGLFREILLIESTVCIARECGGDMRHSSLSDHFIRNYDKTRQLCKNMLTLRKKGLTGGKKSEKNS